MSPVVRFGITRSVVFAFIWAGSCGVFCLAGLIVVFGWTFLRPLDVIGVMNLCMFGGGVAGILFFGCYVLLRRSGLVRWLGNSDSERVILWVSGLVVSVISVCAALAWSFALLPGYGGENVARTGAGRFVLGVILSGLAALCATVLGCVAIDLANRRHWF